MADAVVCTLTFGRAQDVCVAEPAHKGHTTECVQPDGPRAEILHGHIPHLIGQEETVRGHIAKPRPRSPALLGTGLTSKPAK